MITGNLTRGADVCPFSLTGEGTQVDSVTFHITYSGTTCLGPMQGANDLSLAPHSAPTSFTITGTITDGTSGGILPGIEVSAAGHGGPQRWRGPLSTDGCPGRRRHGAVRRGELRHPDQDADAELRIRCSTWSCSAWPPPAPAPAPVPSSGDQIDMHSVIVRGGCCGDVANWPVTTQIRVLDFNFGGVFVDFSAKNSWPEVIPPGWDGGIQYTLWMVEKINGQWITAGGVEYWQRPRAAGRSAVAARVELVLQPAGLGRARQPSAGGGRAWSASS